MSLLLDANMSWRLLKFLEPLFPGVRSVRSVGLARADDDTIWWYAHRNGLSIVTQDVDFVELARLRGTPPKVIWLRTGNTSTEALKQLFAAEATAIRAFLEDPSLDSMLLK